MNPFWPSPGHAGRAVAALLVVGLSSQAGGDTRVNLRLESLQPGAALLLTRYSPSQQALLEKLNRADLDHLGNARRLVVPDDWTLDELAYAPFPPDYPAARHERQLLVVHVAIQAFAAYEHGRLARWGPVSTGAKGSPTPAGIFALAWRSPGHASSVDPAWYLRWYFNFNPKRGLAFHEYALPGRPASHGCIRLLSRDARWLFDWGSPEDRTQLDGGTPVLILGGYDFSAGPPWFDETRPGAPVQLPDHVR